MKITSLLSTLVLATSLVSSIAFAEDAPKKVEPAPVYQQAGYNFVGASLGLAKPVGTNLSTPLRFSYGLEFSHAYSTYLAAGAFVSRSEGVVNQSSNTELALTRVGVEAILSPTYESYLVLRTGISFLGANGSYPSNSVVRNATDAKPLFIGPGLGLLLPVCDKLQLSPNMHYAHFFATKGAESFNVFDVMLTLRYTL
jgi:hypothetical protein